MLASAYKFVVDFLFSREDGQKCFIQHNELNEKTGCIYLSCKVLTLKLDQIWALQSTQT